MAKRKSLFDDPTIEIQELTTVINQDIKNLNGQIAFLQQQQSSAYGRPNKQVESHTSTIVKSLKNKLQKTTKGFTQILEIRTEVNSFRLMSFRTELSEPETTTKRKRKFHWCNQS